MKTEIVIRELGLRCLTCDAPEEFDGVYAGDFLSRAMSHVEEGNLWVTIMSNVNVVAVASLTEAAAVILAEGVEMTDDVKEAAKEKGVAVYSTDKTVFEACCIIGKSVE